MTTHVRAGSTSEMQGALPLDDRGAERLAAARGRDDALVVTRCERVDHLGQVADVGGRRGLLDLRHRKRGHRRQRRRRRVARRRLGAVGCIDRGRRRVRHHRGHRGGGSEQQRARRGDADGSPAARDAPAADARAATGRRSSARQQLRRTRGVVRVSGTGARVRIDPARRRR